MTGFDKASFDEREAYAMENLEKVYDSADNPLTVRSCQSSLLDYADGVLHHRENDGGSKRKIRGNASRPASISQPLSALRIRPNISPRSRSIKMERATDSNITLRSEEI